MQHLFVYGSLIPGQENDFVLSNFRGTWQKASIKGFYNNKGWGKTYGYPAVILHNEGKPIKGMLFSSGDLSSNWKVIDDFEGEMYQRVLTKALLPNDKEVKAYIYKLNDSLAYDINFKKK